MSEQDRISRIEKSITDLESIIHELKSELNDIRQNNEVPAVATPSILPEAEAALPVATEQIADAAPTVTKPVADAVPAATAPAVVPPTPEPTVVPQAVAPVPAPKTVTPASCTTPTPKKTASSGFEENLGGKVMGIVASVLVFVGLFLFGSLVYERLGETARIASLFIVSFLLLGAGLFFERKHKSAFTTSLIGCGFGAVYISLFITTLYFDLISVEVLYLLLLLWLAGIGLYVFRRQSYVVASLGQAGIVFSVIFGCLGIDSKGQFTFLCVYFTVFSLLYLWLVLWRFLPKEKEKPYPWIPLVAAGLNLVQLWTLTGTYDSLFGTYGDFGGKNWTAALLLCLYALALPCFFLLRARMFAGLPLIPWKEQTRSITKEVFPMYKAGTAVTVFYGFYQIAVLIVFSTLADSLFEASLPNGLFLLSGLLLSATLLDLFGAIGTEGRGACIVNAVALPFALLSFNFPAPVHALICIVFCCVSVLFGVFGTECPLQQVRNTYTKRWEFLCKEEKGRCVPKFLACFYAFLLLFSYQSDDALGVLFGITAFGLLFFGASFYVLYKKCRTHRFADGWKTALYLCSLFYVFWIAGCLLEQTSLEHITQMTLLLSLLALYNGIAYYTPFRKKLGAPASLDGATHVSVRLVHSVLWIWAIALLHSGAIEDHPVLCGWLVLLSLYQCACGMYEQYKSYRTKTGLGIYFGLRVTIYTIAVMTSFSNIEGYVISCVLLLLAVLAVLTGFPFRLAPLRIYGLCLAMISVVKLLMIDIEHDNSMETVLCFLGAGILCFAINFIYNHVKKRFQNDTN